MQKSSTPPVSVTIITFIVLCMTSWNAIRTYSAIVNWQILAEFKANPAYILATGLFWFITGLWLIGCIWKKVSYTFRASLAVAGLYYLWYWCDRLYIQTSPAPNVLFSAVFSTVLLVVYSIILSIPASRAFLNKE